MGGFSFIKFVIMFCYIDFDRKVDYEGRLKIKEDFQFEMDLVFIDIYVRFD